MEGFFLDRIIAFRKEPAQGVDLEAGLPLSNEVSKFSTAIERLDRHQAARHGVLVRQNDRRATLDDAMLKMMQQLPEEISKQLATAERRATIDCDGCHCQAQQTSQSGSRN